MGTFRSRLISHENIVFVFAACVVPIYSWSILIFFKELPYRLQALPAWDLVGIFAYSQIFALLESGMILLIPVLGAAILPARFLRDRFVAQGSVLVLLTLGWLIVGMLGLFSNFWWVSLYLISMGLSYILIYRYKRLEQFINSFTERLTVLLYVYIPVTLLSVIIVILRNI